MKFKKIEGQLLAIAFVVIGCTAYAQSVQQQNFPLTEVRLLDGPFLAAEQTDMNYMMKLEPDRLLAPFLREAGLPAKAQSYGNWENTGLDGHTAGHYLTALAQMYAASGDVKWKQRLNYMVSELKRCQDNRTDGYVGGIPGGPEMWKQVKEGNMALFRTKWVPWYNIHKLYAGLRDAYLIAGNEQAKIVLIKLSDWALQEVSGLNDDQMQHMLGTEQGGMNEVFADVAAITGDNKYLTLAKKFTHKAILLPLEAHQDKLNNLHANTQIPKVIGFERIAQLDHDAAYDDAARFFWETVVGHRSISIGGNSVREHFNPSNDFSSMLKSEQGPETCNSYNMLKLTKMLYLSKPDSKYIDYYERTLYNHILSSQHPGDNGGFVYFTPIRPQHYRVYSQPDDGFWCCVGTGMENHGKYGEMIYTRQGDNIYVNLFIASVLNWKEKGITVTQHTAFPFKENTELQLSLKQPETFTIYIRKPLWVKPGGFTIMVNGKPINLSGVDKSYIAIKRRWVTNDKISVMLPMADHLEYLPDGSQWVSVVHGPIVLAAETEASKLKGLMADGSRMGHVASGELYPMDKAPLLVDNGLDISQQLKASGTAPLNFSLANMIYQPGFKNLQLKPFFEVHDTSYMLYWPIAKAGHEEEREKQIAENDRMVMTLAQRTVDQVSPGEQQPESDHFMEADNSSTGLFKDRHWRNANGYFSYKMKITPLVNILQLTCYGANKDREFDVYLNDRKVSHIKLDGNRGEQFFTQNIEVPADLKKLTNIIVKFVAVNGSATGDIYDVRLMK